MNFPGSNWIQRLDASLGAKADAQATSDTGTFSYIALFKRLLARTNIAEIVQSTANSTTATLTAGGSFVGAWEPILNYAQINLTMFGRPNVAVSGDGSDAQASLFFEFSPNGVNADISVPIFVRTLGVFIPYPLINVGAFYRVRLLNDGGAAALAILNTGETAGTPTAQTILRLQSYLLPTATKEIARTLDQSISGSDPLSLVRSVSTSKNPAGTFVNLRAGGHTDLNSSAANLAGNGTFTGTWEQVDQFVAVSAIVKCTQNSASGGVQFQFRDQTAQPLVGDVPQFIAQRSFTGSGTGQSFRVDKPAARWFRMVYVNGAVAQTDFALAVNFEMSSLATKVQVAAPESAITKQVTVGTAAVQLDSTALIDRLSFEVCSYATNSNNNRVFVGFDTTVTINSGANPGRPVENGESFKMDLSLNKQVWAIATAAGMLVQFTQSGE